MLRQVGLISPRSLSEVSGQGRNQCGSQARVGRILCLPNVGLSCKPRKQARRPKDAVRRAGDCQIQALVGLCLGLDYFHRSPVFSRTSDVVLSSGSAKGVWGGHSSGAGGWCRLLVVGSPAAPERGDTFTACAFVTEGDRQRRGRRQAPAEQSRGHRDFPSVVAHAGLRSPMVSRWPAGSTGVCGKSGGLAVEGRGVRSGGPELFGRSSLRGWRIAFVELASGPDARATRRDDSDGTVGKRLEE